MLHGLIRTIVVCSHERFCTGCQWLHIQLSKNVIGGVPRIRAAMARILFTPKTAVRRSGVGSKNDAWPKKRLLVSRFSMGRPEVYEKLRAGIG